MSNVQAVANAVQAAAADQSQNTQQTPVAAVDAKMQQYAAKERQLQQMRRQVEQEKAAWQQQASAKDTEYKTNWMQKQRLMDDPITALSELGIDSNRLTEMLLNAGNVNDPTIKALNAKIAAIEQQYKQSQEQADQATKAQYEAAKKQIGAEVKSVVDASGEAYEGIRTANLHDAVVELIEETFNTEGYLMSAEEACTQVENYLIENTVKHAQLSKVKAKLGMTNAQVDTAQSANGGANGTQQQQAKGQQTITNALTTQGKPKFTEAERKARAIAAMTGQLK